MTAPPLALFGKLPAQGDFVRRGDPALALRLEAWLDAEVERRFAATGAVPEPETCWFATGEGLVGALVASRDRVGRAFPLAAVAEGFDEPERIAAQLVAARDAGEDADALLARLLALHADPIGRSAPGSELRSVDRSDPDAGDWPDEAAVGRLRETMADAGL